MSTPGSGAIIQLAAVGPQECMLRGPCWSPFVIQYKRTTPFAAWTEQIDMQYAPTTRTQIKIPKSGTLMTEMYLEIILPAVPGAPAGAKWTKCVGYTLLRRMRLLLNDQEIHNIERLWMDLYDILYTSASHEQGLDRMVGRTPLPMDVSHTLHIPLRFLSCRPGRTRAPLPLQAITRADLLLDIEWESPSVLSAHTPTDPGIQVKVLVDYVELDAAETAEALRGTTVMFESVVDSDARSFVVDSGGEIQDTPVFNVNLGTLRYPVKGLVWVAYPEDTNELFTYLEQPLKSASLMFNRQERHTPMSSAYYELMHPYLYTFRSYAGPPGVYSFALRMTDRANTGSADFAGLTQASIVATVSPGVPRFKLKVFALYYNVLQISPSAARVMYV